MSRPVHLCCRFIEEWNGINATLRCGAAGCCSCFRASYLHRLECACTSSLRPTATTTTLIPFGTSWWPRAWSSSYHPVKSTFSPGAGPTRSVATGDVKMRKNSFTRSPKYTAIEVCTNWTLTVLQTLEVSFKKHVKLYLKYSPLQSPVRLYTH